MQTLPSLHRPALVNYWISNQSRRHATGPALDRKSRLCAGRLRAADRMRRSAATPTIPTSPAAIRTSIPTWDGVTAEAGQWDVDNDGDGVPDSVWVDLGMPVRTTTDGRLYKPLFAILCVDLDGRINLNAHGSLAQADATRLYGRHGHNAHRPILCREAQLQPAVR